VTHLAVCISGHVGKERISGAPQEVLEGYAKAFSRFGAHDYFLSLSFSDSGGQQIAEQLVQKLAPKAYRLAPDLPMEVSASFSGKIEGNIENTLKMFGKIREANNLKKAYAREKGIVYTHAVRSRPDMIFVRRVVIPLVLRLKFCDLVIPSFPWKYKEFPFAQTDWYALGRDSSMDRYANIENHIEKLVKAGILFHAETLLGNYLKTQRLRVFNIKSPCYFNSKYQGMNGYRR
jgi:hypothetical protein